MRIMSPHIYLSIYPSIHLSIYPSIHLSIYPSIHLTFPYSFLNNSAPHHWTATLGLQGMLRHNVCVFVHMSLHCADHLSRETLFSFCPGLVSSDWLNKDITVEMLDFLQCKVIQPDSLSFWLSFFSFFSLSFILSLLFFCSFFKKICIQLKLYIILNIS